jgi:arylformamidase
MTTATRPIYRGYDRASLDLQYDNSRRVPRFAEHLESYRKESARTRDDLGCRLDLSYGPSEAERLDVFGTIAARAPAPVQVFFHGGYWRALDKSDFSFVARPLAAGGAVTVVVNYALVPAVRMAELVRQCRASLRWVRDNIGRYGGDPERIYVSGHSAGGHLVATMLTPEGGSSAPVADLVRGGVAISGVYDLEPIRLCYLNDTLHLTEAEVQEFSPIRHVPRRGAHLVLAYGAEESEEFARHAESYGEAARRAGAKVEVRPLAGFDHMSVAAALIDRDSEPTRLILSQMGLI